jgi:LCP family protein required for cell wall assembly
MSTPPETPSTRRGLPRWAKATIISFLVLANLAVAGLIYVVVTGQNLLADAATNDEVLSILTDPTGDSLTFLIVGSDTREGLDDLTNFGDFAGERGDAVMLVKVDASSGSARILSIPRDLYLEIPGHGRDRINSAYAIGGGPLIVETVQSSLGIPVNHYVEINFVGFITLIDELGGVEITFDHPARDSASGLDVEAGTQLLNGEQALAYARSRKYQEYQNGQWVSVDANDVGRAGRQQDVMQALMSRLKSPSSVLEAGEIASTMSRHMTIDASLASASVAELAWSFKGVLTGGMDASTLPVKGAAIDGKSVVVTREPEASQVIEAFVSADVVAGAPLRIQVLNGNGVVGSASRMSERLAEAGFQVESIGDATDDTYVVTTVLVPEGSTEGQRIVAELGFGLVRHQLVDSDYDAIVIVGADAS